MRSSGKSGELRFTQPTLVLKIHASTIIERGSLWEAACRSWVVNVPKANRVGRVAVVLIETGECVAVYENCKWTRCSVRPGKCEFSGDESADSELIGRMLPDRWRRVRSSRLYLGPGSSYNCA